MGSYILLSLPLTITSLDSLILHTIPLLSWVSALELPWLAFYLHLPIHYPNFFYVLLFCLFFSLFFFFFSEAKNRRVVFISQEYARGLLHVLLLDPHRPSGVV